MITQPWAKNTKTSRNFDNNNRKVVYDTQLDLKKIFNFYMLVS